MSNFRGSLHIGASSVTDAGLYFQWGDISGYTASQVGNGSGQKAFTWADYKYTTNGQWTGINKYQYDVAGLTDGIWYDENENYIGDNKSRLEPMDDAAVANWGGSWRMPNDIEFIALLSVVNTAWTANYNSTGVAGLVLTDKTDSSKVLFFPAAGYCYNGSVKEVGSEGYCCWSNDIDDYPYCAHHLCILDDSVIIGSVDNAYDSYRCNGLPIRPVTD